MKLWRIFLAWTGLSRDAVCEMSRGRWEFHDYCDGEVGEPWHFYVHKCRRCGKAFEI